MWGRMRRVFISGLLAILPIVITFYILLLLYRLINALVGYNAPLGKLLRNTLGKQFPNLDLEILITILGIIITVVVIMLIGAVTRHYLGRVLQTYFDRLLHTIPILRTIYKTTKQVTGVMLNPESLAFKRVVLLEYPRKGIYSVGLVTSENMGRIHSFGERVLAVFVPTPPNILNGTIVIIPESEAIYLDMSVEEGLRMLISMGIAVPEKRKKEEPQAES